MTAGRLAGMLVLLAVACGAPGPVPIEYGVVECDHCHMTVTDPPFAAELVTTTGKVHVFDDPGCLAAFVAEGTVPATRVHSLWVNDFLSPSDLLRAEEASYLLTDRVRTPMNTQVVALRPGARADSLRAAWDGQLISWEAVVERSRAGHGG